jgi:hypothetical protein
MRRYWLTECTGAAWHSAWDRRFGFSRFVVVLPHRGARTGIACMMLVSLTQTTAYRWSIRRGNIVLFRELLLGPAITLAREIARDEHLCSGRAICVEMLGTGGPIRLASYARPPVDATEDSSGDTVAA